MARPPKKELAAMGTPIAEAKIKPHKHPSFLLGTYTDIDAPKGFSIAIHPDPSPADSVVTRVARSGTDDHYKLVLHVINNSVKTIGVHVHRL